MSGRERKEGPDVLSDIEIAQATKPQHISAIAEKAGVPESYLELYGTNKAKVDYNLLTDEEHAPGKLILVTAINPTPAGEGKTTTTVGLADALARQGKNVVVALREPSLGPVFGVKGGAAGGGYAQVIPMRTSTCTSPATSTPSARRTTCWLPCWTTIYLRATPSTSTRGASPGAGPWT